MAGEDSVRALYFELADLLLHRASLTDNSQGAEQYLRRARDAIETYKAAELRDYFRDDCVDTLQARIAKLDRWLPERPWCIPSSSRIDWSCWSASPTG